MTTINRVWGLLALVLGIVGISFTIAVYRAVSNQNLYRARGRRERVLPMVAVMIGAMSLAGAVIGAALVVRG